MFMTPSVHYLLTYRVFSKLYFSKLNFSKLHFSKLSLFKLYFPKLYFQKLYFSKTVFIQNCIYLKLYFSKTVFFKLFFSELYSFKLYYTELYFLKCTRLTHLLSFASLFWEGSPKCTWNSSVTHVAHNTTQILSKFGVHLCPMLPVW